MAETLLIATVILWCAAAVSALIPAFWRWARPLLALGTLTALVFVLMTLPGASATFEPGFGVGGAPVTFSVPPEALWLMGFGLLPAFFAALVGSPLAGRGRAWAVGAALSLLGALGVFGLQDGIAFLIAWEIMSLGGAVMLLGEQPIAGNGRPSLFMLASLEVGTVALIVAMVWLGAVSGGTGLAAASGPGHIGSIVLALLWLIGFGAKLGLLPFYEWYPGAYGSGSGASGCLLSGIVLNAAFFGLSQALLRWSDFAGRDHAIGLILLAVGVLTAILSSLYAFQQDDWRRLLSFSSAENAAIAVTLLGSAVLFRAAGLDRLAALCWTVSLLQLAAHALAKSTLFFTADGVYRATGSYRIAQTGLSMRQRWFVGLGALFAGMSLSAIPPQAGFVSEWYAFQTLFHGFNLHTLSGRIALALSGAGLALTAAVALATFIKVLGVGLMGAGDRRRDGTDKIGSVNGAAVAILGFCVLVLGAGMTWWVRVLGAATGALFHNALVVSAMHTGVLLVPLSAHFAFISPLKLIIVGPLLALIPLAAILLSRRQPPRRAPLWFGGLDPDLAHAATTGLTFSNALRRFYSFVYRPSMQTDRTHSGSAYFVRRLTFDYDVAPVFGWLLFRPLVRGVNRLAELLRLFQSGYLNFYLSIVGILLLLVLLLSIV